MSNKNYLTLGKNSMIVTKEKILTDIQNNFTIEFWAKPEEYHINSTELIQAKLFNQRFVVAPIPGEYKEHNFSSSAGMGISVAKNGLTVFEYCNNTLTPTLVYSDFLLDWTHIAIVYHNKVPSLYLNGHFIKQGVNSSNAIVVPSVIFGGIGSFGTYIGGISDLRLWSSIRTGDEITTNLSANLTGKEDNLIGYWKLSEGSGSIVKDYSMKQNDGTITGIYSWNHKQNEIIISPINGTLNHKRRTSTLNFLFTYFVPSGGVETLNRQRHYALSKRGINCHFLYTQPGSGLQNNIGAPIYVTNKDREIKRIIQRGNFDAIIVGSDLELLQKVKKFGYDGIVIYDNQGLGVNKEFAEQYLKTHARTIINNYCDAIHYPNTNHLVRAFETVFPYKKKYSFNNCFNTNDFKYIPSTTQDSPIIGWVGRIEKNKNWHDFLHIGAKLISKNPSIKLWMFEDNTLGEKDERIAFTQAIKELNLNNNLTVFSNQPHSKMAEYYSIIGDSGGFLCSTSIVESFGYAVLEAIVCKCPVLSTDSDGVRNFIKHNQTGKFFEFGNIEHACREALDLMNNYQLREHIRKNGLQYVKLHFSPEKYADNFINMVTSLNKN